MAGGGARRGTLVIHHVVGHRRPLLDRGSPETKQGPAVANPRIRVCSTVVFSAAPCHARSSAKYLLPSRSGDERSCLTLWKRDMRVDRPRRMVPFRPGRRHVGRMREGITVDVSATDRARLEARAGRPHTPKKSDAHATPPLR